MFDARMNEVYVAAYVLQQGLMQAVIAETLCAPNKLPVLAAEPWAVVGNGGIYVEFIQQQLTVKTIQTEMYPHAYDLAVLAQAAWQQGRAQAPELALPVYLRDSVWQKLPNKS
jgi:tRNA threonylcarbamoyladenosine biosynthesis protein TsaB